MSKQSKRTLRQAAAAWTVTYRAVPNYSDLRNLARFYRACGWLV